MAGATDIIVIGAGVIGISIALEIQARGRQVHVIDALGVCAGASQGNAGAFAFSDVLPLATPRIIRQAPYWLLNPMGPLSIPLSYVPQISPWLWKFWRASRPSKFAQAVSAQSELMNLSRAALERQIKRVDGEHLMRREGQLQLYDTKRSFDNSLTDWELRKSHGIAFDLVQSAGALADIQPGLAAQFKYGVYTPDWMNTVNPKSWVAHLADRFIQGGGTLSIGKVNSIAFGETGVSVETDTYTIGVRQIVVAAGAHSHQLARTLGDIIPLETERGYNTTLPKGAFELNTHLTFADHGFVVSKIDDGVRVGGSVELGGLKMQPNYRRATHLLNKAAGFLPALNTHGGKQWMGFRPSLPDSLPVISRSKKSRNVIYAFGHGHLGLTQAAATAEIAADLATDTPTPIGIAPFAASRFERIKHAYPT
ncbi:FAD-dependent oxidoreductase [Ascidiaceihabitans sp.]|uniref:NAD(P)/FAD-dependent oxidoreductase n=1 Tax=Ascidiaceihabitans sp. TaxID=1872644 RepID=UPI00329783A8